MPLIDRWRIELDTVIDRTCRRYRMSGFIKSSRQTLDSIIDERIKILKPPITTGIFGLGDTASIVHQRMLRAGLDDIFFTASNPLKEFHRDKDLFDVRSPIIHKAGAIITASLSSSESMRKFLLDRGYKGRILTLPDMKHLSTIVTRDPCHYGRIRALKDAHPGRPAFVIGNAPSLNDTDPRRIPAEFLTLAGNGIVRLDSFSPHYYFALDASALRMWHKEISQLGSRRILLPAHLQGMLRERTYRHLLARRTVFYPACYERTTQRLRVDHWFEEGFETGHTVICPMLQFAAMMGCSQIYMIGVDLSYGTGRNYFSDRYHTAGAPRYQKEVIDAFQSRLSRGIQRAVQACRDIGIEVYNCAPTRAIGGMEYRNFDEVIMGLKTAH